MFNNDTSTYDTHPQRRNPRRILWCVWFALLMAAPYAPYLYTAFPQVSYYPYACAATSLSKAFPWVALGMLLGFWLASHPTVERKLNANPLLKRAVLGTGAALSGLAVITSWTYTALALHSIAIPSALTLLVRHSYVIATLGALGCGAYAWFAIGAAEKPCASPRPLTRHTVAAFIMGVLQPLAWVLILPHAELPLPVENIHFSTWSFDSLLAALALSLLPTAFMLLFALRTTAPAVFSAPAKILPAMALCAGILAFRIASRIAPSLHGTSIALAIAALCAYAVAYIVVVAKRLPSFRTLLSTAKHQPAIATETDLLNAIPAHVLNRLKELELTQKELLVLCADAVDLTSAQAGVILNASDSTIRERRSHYRSKLGVQSAQEALMMLDLQAECATVQQAPANHTQANPLIKLTIALPAVPWPTIALCCLITAGLLLLLPFPCSIQSETDVWTTSFGMGCGLLLAWAICLLLDETTGSVAPSQTRTAIVAGMLVASACLLLAWRADTLPLALGGVPHKAYVIGFTAVFTCSAALLAKRVLDSIDTPSHKNSLSSAALTVAVGMLAAGTHAAVWTAIALITTALGAALTITIQPLAGSTPNPSQTRPAPLPLSWMSAICFFAWLWSECWRAVAYTNLIHPLQWGVLALVVIAAVKSNMVRRETQRLLLCIAVAGAAAACALHPACLPLVCGLFMAIELLGSRPHSTYRPWLHPFIPAALGFMGGALITNAAVFYLDNVNSIVMANLAATLTFFTSIDGYEGVRFAYWSLIAIPLLATIWACSQNRKDLTLTNNRELFLGRLVSLGITSQQANIALLLAAGYSIDQVSNTLPCSRSAVFNARKAVLSKLHIDSVEKLEEALNRSSKA